MSRRNIKHRGWLVVILAVWAALIVIGITEQALGRAGWAVLTALIASAAYLAGRRARPGRMVDRISRVDLNGAYGHAQGRKRPLLPDVQGRMAQHSEPRAYYGGAWPPGSAEPVSAYPPELVPAVPAYDEIRERNARWSQVRGQVIDALTGMGYPKGSISHQVIAEVMVKIHGSGDEPTVNNVLPVILRQAGEAKSRRVEPDEH